MRRGTWAGAARAGGDSDAAVLRRYYGERDYILSPEGVMKLVSVVLCVVSSVVLLSATCAGGGAGGGAWRAAGAALELACAAALAGLSAARLLQLVAYAPVGCLFADLIVSTVIGIALLVTAVLSLTLCDLLRASDYIHGLVGIANAGIVTGSAVVTHVSVTRRWDAARAAAPPAPPPPAPEHDA